MSAIQQALRDNSKGAWFAPGQPVRSVFKADRKDREGYNADYEISTSDPSTSASSRSNSEKRSVHISISFRVQSMPISIHSLQRK